MNKIIKFLSKRNKINKFFYKRNKLIKSINKKKYKFLDFKKPEFISISNIGNNNNEITIGPFEKSFAHTIGNLLRRILISHISGCAITEVKIKNNFHEYSSMDGVKESFMEILSNLRNLPIKMEKKNMLVLQIFKSGLGTVTANDIEKNDNVKIVDPNYKICSLTERNSFIDMKIKIERGRGYIYNVFDKNYNENYKIPIGKLLINANYNPIKNVSYSVENNINYENLIIKIKTNGTISPKKSILKAFTILFKQIISFINLSTEDNYNKIEDNNNLLYSIKELNLSFQYINFLKKKSIKKIGELIQYSEKDLKNLNFDINLINQIKSSLLEYNLKLGTKLNKWPLNNI